MRGVSMLFASAAIFGMACIAHAQPTNVRAWYAQGQVFVVWERPAPPASPTDTVEIYASAAAQISTVNMTRVGRMFFPEYTGARLQELNPAARLLIPTPAGGTYRLAVNEGVFAYTPRAAGNQFFAVVDSGSNVVLAGNSAATAFGYDPVNDPVRPHPQFGGATPGGNPFTAYVVFANGSDDYDNARPDVPVLADADKNGVPHVFTITEPVGGVPAATPLKVGVALHGGGGEYQLFRPGVPARNALQLSLTDGIIITPDDSIYTRNQAVLERTNSGWFGYTPAFDPFFAGVRAEPPAGSIVVNFTSRRVLWFLDWVQNRSAYDIDPTRIAIIGHSGGGRGTSTISRQAPERFCAAVCYTPASYLDLDGAGQINYYRGNWDTNLDTNILDADGTPLGITDVFTMTTRLSTTERDLPLTRVVYGKRDEEGAAAWHPNQIAIMEEFNDTAQGYMIFWDEREHGVEKWATEENDATDDPAHTDPWPDVGQWVAPVRTVRHSMQYLVDTYTNQQSFPGFFNVDADPLLPDRQPETGPGDPDLGEPYGTWGGYFEWDTATLVDEPNRWAATIYATGLSGVSIDNSPFASFTTDLVPRRTRNFNPPVGKLVGWRVLDAATQAILQSGSSVAGAEGEVIVSGIVVPRDPARVRVILGVCGADFNNSGTVTVQDIFDFLSAWNAGLASADFNGVGGVTVQDIFDFLAAWNNGCG
jgi:pimeloyl-ACP methyl ester carboxylesterase